MSKIFIVPSIVRHLLLSIIFILSIAHASEKISDDINPDKAKPAVQKIKIIIQTMQARELDYFHTTKAFIENFSNPKLLLNDRFNIIDPFWSNCRVNNTSLKKR
ncbi:MAG: hypothetical protein ACRYGR_06955 [Janthinobacterium lividum]